METLGKAFEWTCGRQWSLYPFIPPLLAILLSKRTIPWVDKLFRARLEEYLQSEGADNLSEICWGVARDYRLRITYLLGVVSFATSAIIEQGTKGGVGSILICSVLLGMIMVAIPLFTRAPSYHSNTRLPDKKIWMIWRRNRNDPTYADVYFSAIRWLNVIVIIVIILNLPEKPSFC